METPQEPKSGSLQLNENLVISLLEKFLKDEISNAGFSKGIVGLSGGIDSAVSTYLAVRALGRENVKPIILPHRSSSKESVDDAILIGKELGIETETVDITAIVDSYSTKANVSEKVRIGNIMARARMIVLFDISMREKGLVIGTSNKTELLLGYGTVHGDMACALNPIGDLYKTQVRQIARALGVPQRIIDKIPTADLWPGQTDEGELGFNYTEVDQLLYRMIDEGRTDSELEGFGFDMKFISQVREIIRKSHFKRRLPLIAKISHRTINVDFRYVRDWGI